MSDVGHRSVPLVLTAWTNLVVHTVRTPLRIIWTEISWVWKGILNGIHIWRVWLEMSVIASSVCRWEQASQSPVVLCSDLIRFSDDKIVWPQLLSKRGILMFHPFVLWCLQRFPLSLRRWFSDLGKVWNHPGSLITMQILGPSYQTIQSHRLWTASRKVAQLWCNEIIITIVKIIEVILYV